MKRFARLYDDGEVHLLTMLSDGSTEAGGAPLLLPKREDWEYMEFHPCLEITMEPVVDKLFELVFKESTSAALYRGNVWTFPEVRDWWTRDLFEVWK